MSVRSYGGLGLYIVRGIVAALGGSVSVESAPDVGSSFVVELNRVQDEAAVTANDGMALAGLEPELVPRRRLA